MIEKLRKMGIDIIGDVSWGTHFCIFYQDKEDLTDILVPYFKAGLENNEFCMWITSEPLKIAEAKEALKQAVSNLDDYIRKKQIEILDYSQWYTETGEFKIDKVLKGWMEKEKQAIRRGFDGLRISGDAFWVEKRDWKKYQGYESIVNNVIDRYRILVICSYSLNKYSVPEIIDVVSTHQFVLIRRKKKWVVIESSGQKKIEQALQTSESKYKTLLENLPQKIFLKDINSVYISCNENYARDLKIKPDKITGKTDYEFYPKELAEKYRADDRRIMQSGETEDIEEKYIQDRREVIVHTVKTPVRDEQGNVIGILGIFWDITDHKKAEEILKRDKDIFERLVMEKTQELLNTQKELGKARRLSDLGRLAVTVAHELRNPLGVIRTAAYNIRRKRSNATLDRHLSHIEKKISESSQIINNLLNYSRIKIPSYEKIKIYNILNECIVSVKKNFYKQKVNIVKRYICLKNIFIEAGPLQVREIFNNILTNAYQAILEKKGKINIEARCDAGNSIEISFKDNGEGIDREDLERVFEPFFTRRSKGTGLGLTICKELIVLYNGKIGIESERGKGTVVTILLPIRREKIERENPYD